MAVMEAPEMGESCYRNCTMNPAPYRNRLASLSPFPYHIGKGYYYIEKLKNPC